MAAIVGLKVLKNTRDHGHFEVISRTVLPSTWIDYSEESTGLVAIGVWITVGLVFIIMGVETDKILFDQELEVGLRV